MTEKSANETPKKAPIIKATFEPRGPLYVVLLIQNIGDAAAVKVNLQYQFKPSDSKTTISLPFLMPSQKIRFLAPEENMKVLTEKFTTLKLSGECENVYGEKYQVNDEIDIKQVLQSWIDARILLEETIENRLADIAFRLDRLERGIDRMLSGTRGILIRTREDEKREREEIKRYYEEQKQKGEEDRKKASGSS